MRKSLLLFKFVIIRNLVLSSLEYTQESKLQYGRLKFGFCVLLYEIKSSSGYLVKQLCKYSNNLTPQAFIVKGEVVYE